MSSLNFYSCGYFYYDQNNVLNTYAFYQGYISSAINVLYYIQNVCACFLYMYICEREKEREREISHTGVYIVVFCFIKDDADLTSYESCNEDDQEIENKLNIKLPKYAKQLPIDLLVNITYHLFGRYFKKLNSLNFDKKRRIRSQLTLNFLS